MRTGTLAGWMLLAFLSLPLQAAIEVYQFDDPAKEERFKELSTQLRCLVCQNQSIADSNAELAQDLRREIYGMIKKGMSNQAIIDFMVQRYGDFVLYRPPVNKATAFLWVGPFLMGLLGLALLVWVIRQRTAERAEGALSGEEQARLDALVETTTNNDDEPRKQ